MSANRSRSDNTIYDPDGTSHLFDQLVWSSSMLAWNFDEQIDGVPMGLLRDWRYQLGEAQGHLAFGQARVREDRCFGR